MSMEESQPILPAAHNEVRSVQRMYSYWAVIPIFIVPALGGLNFGFDIGATSFAIVQMQSPDFSGMEWWEVVKNSSLLKGFILSAASCGAFLGSTLTFAVNDRVSRRQELRAGSMLYLLGAVLQTMSGLTSTRPLTLLVFGRLIYGVGIGVTMHAAPTYLAEMGPADIRGILVSLKEAFIVLGILFGYLIGYIFSKVVGGWPWIYASSVVASTLMLFCSFLIPRSSRWLLLQGLNDEALQSLKFLYKDEECAQIEFDAIRDGMQPSDPEVAGEGDEDVGGQGSIWEPIYRAPLVAGIGLVILQQITGQPSVLSYSTAIFRDAGLSDYAPVLVAAFKLIATLGAAVTVEKYGRKSLLFGGCSLMLVALTMLSVLFERQGRLPETFILVAMFVYIGGYQVGFGPVTWLLTSELYPLKVRGQAVAFTVQMNFLLNTLVQFGIPVLEKHVGLRSTFACFAALTAYSISFVGKFVPETKGKTLEEIERQFEEMRTTVSDVVPTPLTTPLLENE